ncbi:hypothetical protein Acr_06g0009990 [Actinidia rufa]|uniref:Uncharacterized protein n=1 Tax=Actinidia rufa TaxID=165716 RepID=A0A7J0EST1_9ERIC|nr:hypothetical protein Acr_06g0009990 [Actinidia rufa]
MHLRSRYLPKPSASSPPDNRAHPMANPGQVPNLEGLHREIHDMAEQMRIMNENNGRLMQLFTTANLRQHHPSLISSDLATLIVREIVLKISTDRTAIHKKRVLRARISSKFKLPAQLGIYEGKTDPMNHLNSYKSLMSLQSCSDEIMCKAFSTTLKGPARSWIRKLSPGTIDSFADLSRLFVANFMSCKNRQKNASHLFTVHQKETESLKDFVKRFNQAILEVKDPSDKVIIMAMMEGLRLGPLFDSLSKNIPETLSTLQSKADKYIAVEELAKAKRRRRGKDDHKRKEPDTRRIDYREETRHKRPDRDPKRSNDRRPRTPPRRPEFILPPLNAPVTQVLLEIKHEEFVKWPGKIKTDPQKRNRNKYCEFHRDHGHNTEDCFQLKEQIADLIKRGYLRKYVVTRPPPNSPERRYGDNRPTAGDIQTIHGGFGSSNCSTSSKKKNARSVLRLAEEEIYNLSSSYIGDQTPITFSNDDLRGLHLPHDDALVVSAVIANFNVQRILIDNGSSADILFISAFEKMKIRLDKLHLFHTPLTGFGGNTTHPLGWINLPITLGTEPHQTTVWQDFIVVDCPSPYNAILGRPTLGGIKAITSTYHLKLKFSTSTGIGEIKGDQKKFAPECLKVIEDEVNKLIRANVVREVHYPDWLANVVVAPQKGGKWRVCVDFTDLNKACPKDSFSLPKIDLIVDATSKHELLKRGLYCYKVMPFELKNAGATYQRLVNKMFKKQIGKTMEVYIDDMLVKSLRSSDHIAHLKEAFSIMRRHRMMLNPSKCIFGVSSGKFLGFLVTKRGIEQLTGRVAALNRFVSKSADKCLPFFKILRKSQIFQWNEESENAFQQLKEYLGSPPLLTVPTTGEDLYVYLSISPTAVSVVLIQEEDQVQKRIYYISKVLMGAEASYPRIEKLAYALMIAARKLRHYFQAHSIIILTDQPLKQILQRPDTSGRLLKWSIELKIAPPETEIPEEPTSEKVLAHWILFVDGSSNQHGCGAGLVIQTPLGEQMEYAIRIGFKATNNEAEYEALLAGLRVVVELGPQSLKIFSDSQLVVNQVQGDYLAKDARMMAYLGEVKATSAKIKEFKIHQIPREDNKKADALVNLASTFEFISDRCIPLEFLASPSIGVANQILLTEESLTWMDEIIAYLQGGTLPKDKLQAHHLQYKSARFCIFKGRLYKSRLPHTEMVPMSSPWPFAQWGIDILGPLPRAPLQRKFLIVAIDCFTKWIEAQPLAKITEKITRDFVWKHLVCRFGIPKVIISDNARQFDNDKFKLFCSDLAISHHFSSPGHPQANGQVEVTNHTILRNLKARLERSKSEWAEDLPSILWAYHTTSQIPTGETPYSMVFGTESVIPVEIGMPSFRTSNFDKESNEAELRLNLDLLEERREKAELRQAAYKCQVAKYYNQRVKHRSFLPADLVLRRVILSTKEPNAGKLGPTWEGPYKVIKVSRPGTYWLEDPNGKTLLHPWNAEHLKKYYQ